MRRELLFKFRDALFLCDSVVVRLSFLIDDFLLRTHWGNLRFIIAVIRVEFFFFFNVNFPHKNSVIVFVSSCLKLRFRSRVQVWHRNSFQLLDHCVACFEHVHKWIGSSCSSCTVSCTRLRNGSRNCFIELLRSDRLELNRRWNRRNVKIIAIRLSHNREHFISIFRNFNASELNIFALELLHKIFNHATIRVSVRELIENSLVVSVSMTRIVGNIECLAGFSFPIEL